MEELRDRLPPAGRVRARAKLPVIAANAPARYVSRVSASGPTRSARSRGPAKSWLPPLPFPPASRGYAAKFNSSWARGGAAPQPTPAPTAGVQHAADRNGARRRCHLLDAQNLRDASMAHASPNISKRGADALVVHVNGKFHSEERLGVAEQLKHYRPQAARRSS